VRDAGGALVVPAVDPVVPAVAADELASSMPVTSTRLPTLASRSDELPSSTYVVPVDAPARDELGAPLVVPVVPVVPAVVPAVEPVVDPAVLDMAFVKMNDAPLPEPDVVRDGGVPAVVVAPVVPEVPVVVLMSPRCRHPVTVIVPLCPLRVVCGELVVVVCAATTAAQPNAIATIAPARLIYSSLLCVSTRCALQAVGLCRTWRRLRHMMPSRSDHVRSTD